MTAVHTHIQSFGLREEGEVPGNYGKKNKVTEPCQIQEKQSSPEFAHLQFEQSVKNGREFGMKLLAIMNTSLLTPVPGFIW